METWMADAMNDNKGIIVEPRAQEIPQGEDPQAPKIGRWYMVKFERETLLGCVIRVGSNYAKISGTGESDWDTRVHFDEFFDKCTFVEDPDSIVDGHIRTHQGRVHELIEQVKAVTARLGIEERPALMEGSEASALVVRNDQPMNDYKAALILAKQDTLPGLFKEIENENRLLGKWMGAKLIPLKAEANAMKPKIEAIENRIFSVELYAGLVEEVKKVRDGNPAPLKEKIHLLQRRAYMDEECLARYETGGMTFRNIRDFDKWLGRAENLNRLLPFPRCILAFKVRRHAKDRIIIDFADFVRLMDELREDERTFLYIRNGEQLFRLSTGIEFGENLFPDMEESKLEGKLWALFSSDRIEKLISDNEYQAIKKAEEDEEAERLRKYKAAKKGDKWQFQFSHRRWFDDYKPYTPDDVYYDDIRKHIGRKINEHNRLVLVLQGLLDRSPVLHPHPQWQLWTGDGFEQALELVYDETRAFVAGPKPDFEAYRKKLNASIKVGTVTVGQEDAWELFEGRKESRRMDRDYRTKGSYRPARHRPYGNPGPGTLARVHLKGSKTATFEWVRKRVSRNSPDQDGINGVRCTFTALRDKLLNVDAYTPGDFKIFFNDPRTRQEYLRWAPLLLEAEEYHAGNRKLPTEQPMPKRRTTRDGSFDYHRRKALRALIGEAVSLKRDVTMQNGTVYKKGSLWRVVSGRGSEVEVRGILPDGTNDPKYKGISNLHMRSDIELAPSVPPPPSKRERQEIETDDDKEDE